MITSHEGIILRVKTMTGGLKAYTDNRFLLHRLTEGGEIIDNKISRIGVFDSVIGGLTVPSACWT
jgi:hypothetical protein